jgi:hypothetical protein
MAQIPAMDKTATSTTVERLHEFMRFLLPSRS